MVAAYVLSLQSMGAPLRLCFVSSELGAVLPRANDRPSAYGGFQTALRVYNRAHKVPAELILGKGTNVLQQVDWALAGNCDAMVGLVTSRDALLAAPKISLLGKMAAFSSTATVDELDEYFPSVVSAATPMSTWVTAAVKEISKGNWKRVVVISKSDDLYSLFFTKRLSAILGKKAEVWPLDARDQLLSATLDDLIPSQRTLMVYTTYPIHSLPSMAQIAARTNPEAKAHWALLGTQAWLETHTFRAQKEVITRLPPCFYFSPWSGPANPQYLSFRDEYRKEYHADPDHDSTYDYDVTNMILACYDKVAGRSGPLRENLRKCLGEPRSFVGATGAYAFDGKHSHPLRVEQMVPLSLSGTTPVN